MSGNNMIFKIKTDQSGVSALLTIVIIGAASLIIAKSISLLSLNELEMGDKENFGQKYLYSAEACLEEALLQVKEDPTFSATNQNFQTGSIDCQYTVSIDGSNRNISAINNHITYTRTINVLAVISGDQIDITAYNIEE